MNKVDQLSSIIRKVDGGNRLDAAALAKALMSHSQLEIKIKSSLATVDEIRNAQVGELLYDKSLLVYKNDKLALIAAPAVTQIEVSWDIREYVFDNLDGYDWFIPSPGQLYVAYLNCKKFFSSTRYWSSTEVNACCACSVNFFNGLQLICSKTNSYCVRAFRMIEF